MGDMDLLKPVAMAGIPCAVMTRPGVPSLYSRHARTRLPWEDFSKDPEALLETLLRFGKAQNARPVLFYEEDAQLLFVSRHRERLKEAFRFVVADATLVEDLLDKARFQDLAQRHGLPVPPSQHFHPVAAEPEDLDLAFPVILKPLTRLERWNDTFGLRKDLEVEKSAALPGVVAAITVGRSRAAGAATDRRPGIADRKLPPLHRPDRRHRPVSSPAARSAPTRCVTATPRRWS